MARRGKWTLEGTRGAVASIIQVNGVKGCWPVPVLFRLPDLPMAQADDSFGWGRDVDDLQIRRTAFSILAEALRLMSGRVRANEEDMDLAWRVSALFASRVLRVQPARWRITAAQLIHAADQLNEEIRRTQR